MFKEIVIFAVIVATCFGDVSESGPYPPSGWKPQGAPFTLPSEFLPQQPRQVAQQTNGNNVEVEITQERVEYAGQLDETTTGEPNLSNGYLPPQPEDAPEEDSTTDNFLKVQGLPTRNPNNFQQQPQSGRLTNGQVNNQYVPPSGNYRTQNNRQFGQIRQQFRQPLPQAQFGKQVSAAPAPPNTYGPPPPNNENAEPNPPETDNNDNEEDSAENEQPTVAVANAVSNGQYYILTPDQTLQRVMFVTTQNEDEVRTNGFTAQLRYMPVEPIRDPIYAYNTDGQLIRIFNKK